MRRRPIFLAITALFAEILMTRPASGERLDGGPAAVEGPMAPLHVAAQKGQRAAVKDRLEAGDVVDLRGPRAMTPLHYAASTGEVEIATMLLDRGADPNARAAGDMTPLHFACMLAHPEVAGLLTRRGARLDIYNASGLLPIHLAANDKVVNVLVAAGADVNARTSFGYTPLHTARDGMVARALVEQRADLRLRTPKGRTAMELAAIETLERFGISLHSVMLGRLRGLIGQMRVTLTNITAEPIHDLALPATSVACEVDTDPLVLPLLLPGQNADFVWTMVRKVSVPEGEHAVHFEVMMGGKKVAEEDLKVDTRTTVTPEDEGMIRLAKGQIRPAPARWFYFVYAVAPLMVIAAWFFLRRREKSARPGGERGDSASLANGEVASKTEEGRQEEGERKPKP